MKILIFVKLLCKVISFDLAEPPRIMRFSYDLTNGRDLVLQCIVRGNPAPSIVWLRNGKQFRIASGKLVIPLKIARTAKYTCMARNMKGIRKVSVDVIL